MSTKPMKLPTLRGRNAEVMLALRAGPMTLDQLTERFGSDSTARTLVTHGLVSYKADRVVGNAYALTDKGYSLCPSRRDLYATADAYIASQDERKTHWESDGRRKAARQLDLKPQSTSAKEAA